MGEFTNGNYVLRDDLQNPIGTADLTVADTTYGVRLNVPIYQGGYVSSAMRSSERHSGRQRMRIAPSWRVFSR
jgi:hypothetical protein